SVDELQHDLARESLKLLGISRGVEITFLADIPSAGSGLGSSSSFTVGLLNALHVYLGEQAGPEQLAQEACEVEINRCGQPIGKQDQYIAAYGGLGAIRFFKDGSVKFERIRIDGSAARKLSANLALFFSNQVRKTKDILAEQ